jgi:hypothetical protein
MYMQASTQETPYHVFVKMILNNPLQKWHKSCFGNCILKFWFKPPAIAILKWKTIFIFLMSRICIVIYWYTRHISETDGVLSCRKYIGMQEILLLYCSLETKISLKHAVMHIVLTVRCMQHSHVHGQRHIIS